MRFLVATMVLAAVFLGVLVSMAWSCGAYGTGNTDLLARRVVAAEGVDVDAAIAELRAAGPAGLEALLQLRDKIAAEEQASEQQATGPLKPPKPSERLARVDALVDKVAAQRGASVSRLYWYTEFDRAVEAAKAQKKPILSLRMLGDLREECSCANSRFFRTSLYANAEVSKYLRENFVLHWRSVRPVPKVTVDFGDGRKLVRTVTGNSIHYVLDSEGRTIDGLPGLYGPQAFRRWLADTKTFAETLAPLSEKNQAYLLTRYHRDNARRVGILWTKDLSRVAPELANTLIAQETARIAAAKEAAKNDPAAKPTARKAAERAVGKTAVEAPIVEVVVANGAALEKSTNDELWNKIAALHAEDAKLDQASVEVIRRENPPTAQQAARVAITKTRVEDPIVRMVRQFEASIALDTVKNEYLLHRQIHEWLATSAERPEVEALNERVYAQLFLTPSSDPWLGLAPADTYTALENGGAVGERR